MKRSLLRKLVWSVNCIEWFFDTIYSNGHENDQCTSKWEGTSSCDNSPPIDRTIHISIDWKLFFILLNKLFTILLSFVGHKNEPIYAAFPQNHSNGYTTHTQSQLRFCRKNQNKFSFNDNDMFVCQF